MPLESCMILLDCSEYMRNGDYIPTRLEAQVDAANMLVGAKTQSHPESTVGISAGTELLLSPTTDVGMMLRAIHGLNFTSSVDDICAAVQVAGLALKHRRNKNGSQRIIAFVGSPLTDVETRALQKVGRQLKKNNVAIDVVALGELETNEEKLRELVDAANGRSDDGGDRTCHLVTIPAGVLPSDVLANSPVLAADGGAYAAAAGAMATSGFDGGNQFAEFGGVDPNMDPELAMALRVSMEEERVRQERATAAAAQEESKDADMAGTAAADAGLSEEDALLQQALAMSMQENDPVPSGDIKPSAAATMMETDDDEDAAMLMAIQMSMQTEENDSKPSQESTSNQQFQDPAFVSELLGSMPGVDANDPEIQEALRKAAAKKEDEEKGKKGDN
ncbi:26S proteasome regulatory subunit N10 [Fistulifera solaris]|uniref:26S proteasome regulatory subunit N10 n=1 Tax=Fistulifera solaris TaxID=1519565 RepID=A0A1Z5KIB6_FISSO|nr:26S proteasome regulatory subunit N10 [Fistulifera solaris]|eukprot:GAX25832.1 26S proteasome regulatory subunit N10 [Fistulifera solaris]